MATALIDDFERRPGGVSTARRGISVHANMARFTIPDYSSPAAPTNRQAASDDEIPHQQHHEPTRLELRFLEPRRASRERFLRSSRAQARGVWAYITARHRGVQ